MEGKVILPVLVSILILGVFGTQEVFAETLIAASGEHTPSHFSKVNVATGEGLQFLGNSGSEFSGIDFSSDGKLYAASGGGANTPGLYELSVTIESGTSVATPTRVVPGVACSDISFSPNGLLYCMTNNKSNLITKSLYSVDIDSGNSRLIGSTGLGSSSSGNAIAVHSNGIIYFGNDVGLYTLNPVNGIPTQVAPWDLSDTGLSNCKANAMDFDSSDTLHASFQCGFDPYLVTIHTDTAEVSLVGPLFSTNPVYSNPPFFEPGDMKTDAIAFAPFDFDFIVGTTHGTAGVIGLVNVVPNPPNGVLVSTLTPTNFGLCENSSLAIGIGDSFTAECGSVRIHVVDGTVNAKFVADDGSMANSILNKGDDVTFDETVFSITNNGLSVVLVILNGGGVAIIPPGETVLLGESESPPPSDVNDHYLSYKAKQPKDEPKFEKFTVTLDDQFESASYIVDKPDRLYNPVQKTLEDGTTTEITDFESHYVGYKIKIPKGDEKFDKVSNVLVQNQFGDIIVDVKKAKLLLVPSAKSHTDEFLDVLDTPVNHYKCYDAKVTKHTPKFEKLIVTIYDPNFEKTNDFEVKKPKMLCTPVQKTLDDGTISKIIDEQNHLMCYDIKKMKGEPKFEKRNVFTNNQFGHEELEVKKEHQLCVPSIKTLPSLP